MSNLDINTCLNLLQNINTTPINTHTRHLDNIRIKSKYINNINQSYLNEIINFKWKSNGVSIKQYKINNNPKYNSIKMFINKHVLNFTNTLIMNNPINLCGENLELVANKMLQNYYIILNFLEINDCYNKKEFKITNLTLNIINDFLEKCFTQYENENNITTTNIKRTSYIIKELTCLKLKVNCNTNINFNDYTSIELHFKKSIAIYNNYIWINILVFPTNPISSEYIENIKKKMFIENNINVLGYFFYDSHSKTSSIQVKNIQFEIIKQFIEKTANNIVEVKKPVELPINHCIKVNYIDCVFSKLYIFNLKFIKFIDKLDYIEPLFVAEIINTV